MGSESNHLGLLFVVGIRNPKDCEDLYSILSNESPPQNASNQFQKVSLASVQI